MVTDLFNIDYGIAINNLLSNNTNVCSAVIFRLIVGLTIVLIAKYQITKILERMNYFNKIKHSVYLLFKSLRKPHEIEMKQYLGLLEGHLIHFKSFDHNAFCSVVTTSTRVTKWVILQGAGELWSSYKSCQWRQVNYCGPHFISHCTSCSPSVYTALSRWILTVSINNEKHNKTIHLG